MNYGERIKYTKILKNIEGICMSISVFSILIGIFYACIRDIGFLPASFTFGASLFVASGFFIVAYFIVYIINEIISDGRAHPYPPHTDWDNENF
jgi:hypothetical protein